MASCFLNAFSPPSGLLDQHIAPELVLEDFLSRLASSEFLNLMQRPAEYSRPCGSSATQKISGSTVSLEEDKFQAHLRVQHFKPEEISVKVSENTVTVEGKHEEKEVEHGSISRHFVRKYVIPKGHDVDKVESKLSSDGVLTISAPRIGSDSDKEEQRTIPVIRTGQLSKAAEEKEENQKE